MTHTHTHNESNDCERRVNTKNQKDSFLNAHVLLVALTLRTVCFKSKHTNQSIAIHHHVLANCSFFTCARCARRNLHNTEKINIFQVFSLANNDSKCLQWKLLRFFLSTAATSKYNGIVNVCWILRFGLSIETRIVDLFRFAVVLRFLRCDARFSMSFSIDHDYNSTANFQSNKAILPMLDFRKRMQLFLRLVRLISWHEWLHEFFIMPIDSIWPQRIHVRVFNVSAHCTWNDVTKFQEKNVKWNIVLIHYYLLFFCLFWFGLLFNHNQKSSHVENIRDRNTQNNSKIDWNLRTKNYDEIIQKIESLKNSVMIAMKNPNSIEWYDSVYSVLHTRVCRFHIHDR